MADGKNRQILFASHPHGEPQRGEISNMLKALSRSLAPASFCCATAISHSIPTCAGA